jgi:hypothetical protein
MIGRKIFKLSKLYVINPEAPKIVKKIRRYITKTLVPIYHLDNLFASSSKSFKLHLENETFRSIFCLVHHADDGELDQFDKSLLNQIKALEFFTVLITNAPEKNSRYADLVILKGKYGRDFSAMRDMARSFASDNPIDVEFLFMNNSMAWDYRKIESFVADLRKSPRNSLIFPTNSKYPVEHVQPYFIYIRLLSSSVNTFSESFEWIRDWRLRRSIIYFGEYRILSQLASRGWKFEVLAPYEQVLDTENEFRRVNAIETLAHDSLYYNPTQHMWPSLSKFGIAAVKKSLISINPAGIIDPPASIIEALDSLRSLRGKNDSN